jgi:hypothetical protein
MAIRRAAQAELASRLSEIDQPTISRVAMSLIAARYSQPSSVGM